MFLWDSKRQSYSELANVRQIGELVEASRYREAAELLQQALKINGRDDHNLLAQLLMLALQICLTSTQLHDEIERHQQAQADARSREQQLQEQMRVVLELMADAGQSQAAPSRPADANPLWAALAQMVKRPRLASGDDRALPLPPINPNQLVVYCLGPFEVYRNGELIVNWPGRKGMLIFKYLLLNREMQTRKEVLMDLFWQDSDEDAQRNNLNVAIYGLRQALRDGDHAFSHILFQNDCYFLNPELDLWVDYQAFQVCCRAGKRLHQAGDQAGAAREYLAAANFYQGDLLSEDRYESWLEAPRHQLQTDYLNILDYLSEYDLAQQDYAACLSICQKILVLEPCFEDAHYRMMRCYCYQGQPYLALRQYDRCIKALTGELGVPPMPEIENLHWQILNGHWASDN